MGMFDKVLGNIKKRVIREKLNTSIDEIAGIYGVVGKHLPQLVAGTNKVVINGVLDSEKVDKIILGAELIIEGFKAVNWKEISADIKKVQSESGISDEMEKYVANECNTFLDLVGKNGKDRDDLHPDNFEVGDDVTESVKAHPDKWREETPEAVKTFSENLDRNMKEAI